MSDSSYLLREVVVGRATWRELVEAGSDIRAVPGGWAFGPPTLEPAAVTEPDLREGIARQIVSIDHGREWASFVLSASDLFDLEPLSGDGSASCGQVLEALWDLSNGDVASARARLRKSDPPSA